MTKKQKENLKKLFNLEIPAGCEFNMQTFYDAEDDSKGGTKDSYKCGTCACFAGYLPLVTGIDKKKLEWWDEYIERVTGIQMYSNDFHYLFGTGWDNDLKRAKERLNNFINNGYEAP